MAPDSPAPWGQSWRIAPFAKAGMSSDQSGRIASFGKVGMSSVSSDQSWRIAPSVMAARVETPYSA